MKKIEAILTCDRDGAAAVRTVRFSLDGQAREIDVCGPCEKLLALALQPWLDASRRAAAAPRRTRASREQSAEVRAWARRLGIELADRGRIPADVIARYRGAH